MREAHIDLETFSTVDLNKAGVYRYAEDPSFEILLFGYAFLWTVAPNWPPPSYLRPEAAGLVLALAGAVLSMAGPRLAEAGLRRGGGPVAGLTATAAGLAGLVLAAGLVMVRMPEPQSHAYVATLWVIAGYIIFERLLFALIAAVVALVFVRRAHGDEEEEEEPEGLAGRALHLFQQRPILGAAAALAGGFIFLRNPALATMVAAAFTEKSRVRRRR